MPPPRLATNPKAKEPRVPAHAFELDEEVPADFHGRRHCRACGKQGEEGDVQHPEGALPLTLAVRPPLPPGAAEVQARMLGERP